MTSAPNNALTIVGNTFIQFSAGTVAPIRLNGGTQITADPPVASPAALVSAPAASQQSAQPLPGASSIQMSLATPRSELNSQSHYQPVQFASNFSTASATDFVANSAFPASAWGPSNQATDPSSTGVGNAIRRAQSSSAIDFLQGGVSEFNNNESILEAEFSSDRNLGFNQPVSRKLLSMQSGSTVFAPFVDTVVETPFGNVEIAAKSIVVVVVSNRGTAVYNIDDQHRDAVRIISGSQSLPLAPGRHVMLTSTRVSSFDQVNAFESIGYRRLKELEIGCGFRAYHAEFSLPSAIASIKPLRQLLSSRNPDAFKLSSHLLKTIAAMNQLNKSADRYQQIMHPCAAAFNN